MHMFSPIRIAELDNALLQCIASSIADPITRTEYIALKEA